MAQLLVPDKVYLICSEGMTMRQLTVTSQTSVLMAAGRPVATVEDRMDGNFNCVKMMLTGAIVGVIIGAVIAAVTVVTGGAALAAVGAAVVCTAGGAAVGGLAGLIPCICSILTSDWMPFHPQINVENKHPILENSKIPCKLGGMVEICYSEALAKAKQDFKRKETALNLLALAGVSAAVGVAAGGLFISMSSLVSTGLEFGVKAVGKQLLGIGMGFGMNSVVGSVYSVAKDNIHVGNNMLQDYVTGKVYGNEIENSDFNKYADIIQNPLGENASNIPDGETSAKAQSGVYNQVIVGERTQYNVVFVGAPDGTITSTNNVSYYNETTIRSNVGSGSVSKTQKVVSYTDGNYYTDIDGNSHLIIEQETSGVKRDWNTKETATANFKDAVKGFVINVVTDVARAAGNCFLSEAMESIKESEETEKAVKAKIQVYENKI